MTNLMFCLLRLILVSNIHFFVFSELNGLGFVGHENKPLQNAIANLMQLMTRAAGEGIITPQLAFISYFIQTMIETTSIKTKEVMRPLLRLIPPALVNFLENLYSNAIIMMSHLIL